MKKRLMVLNVTLFFVLMATISFAGTTGVVTDGATNTPYVIATEALGVSRTATVASTATSSSAIEAVNVGVSYRLGQQLTSTNLLAISLTGLNFSGQQILVCAANAAFPDGSTNNINTAIQIGQGTPTTSQSTANIQIVASNIAPNSVIYLSTNSACNVAPAFNVNVPAGTVAGSYPIALQTLSSGNIPIDTSSSANLVTARAQYTTALLAGNLITIDYQQASSLGSLNGTHFIDGINAASVNLLAVTPFTSMPGNVATLAGSTSSFNQTITLTDSVGWQGVSKVYTTNSNGSTNPCLYSSNTAVNSAPSGTVTLTPSGSNAFNGASASPVSTTLCIQASGNVPLEARIITGSYAYAVTSGSGLLPPAGQSSLTYQTWSVNAYQAFNPYMYWDVAYTQDVFNRFYNSSTRAANVLVDVYPADGDSIQQISLGTIPSNEAGLYWASDIGVAAGFNPGTSYAARFTITAPPSLVNGVSFFKRASGTERAMPLYKSNSQAYLMQ